MSVTHPGEFLTTTLATAHPLTLIDAIEDTAISTSLGDHHEDPLAAARGIVVALLGSLICWLFMASTLLYVLMR